MKDKLESEMFIRTPIGIDKIECFNKENVIGYGFITKANHYLLWHKEDNKFSIDGECFDKEDIKASFNIIDILEVGDYVNGELVVAIHKNYVCDEIKLGIALETACNYTAILNEDIKSIVTKEQFESMEYSLEG